MLGRYDEAMREYELARAGSGENVEPLMVMGYLHASQGRRAEAEAALRELVGLAGKRPIPGSKMALVHAALGNRDEAFRWLRKACRDRDVGLTFLRVNPRWKQLEGDPRFEEIKRCVSLPDQAPGRSREHDGGRTMPAVADD
jgi:tetratricopeptide (TPR) repeat protein